VNKLRFTPVRKSSQVAAAKIFRAVLLVREAAEILKTKATHLPDSAPSTRLQRIATGFSDFGDSLERVAFAIERGRRKPPGAQKGQLDLSRLEAMLTNALRSVPIGSRRSRELHALRALLRGQFAAGLRVEEEPLVTHRGMALEQGAEGVA
jgi:hypothetical protein